MVPIICVVATLAIACSAWYLYRKRKRQAPAGPANAAFSDPREQHNNQHFLKEDQHAPATQAHTPADSAQDETRCGRWISVQPATLNSRFPSVDRTCGKPSLHCRSYRIAIASAAVDISSDPLISYIRSQLPCKRSQVDSNLTRSGGSCPHSVDLSSLGSFGSLGSQGSVQFDELEIFQLAGEGSFGKVGRRQPPLRQLCALSRCFIMFFTPVLSIECTGPS